MSRAFSRSTSLHLQGFTIIESMVFLFIFAIVSMAFLETYSVGARLIIESKNRLGATALANQKMEIIRSIDYATIGTKRWNGSTWVYGIPPGDLLEEEDIAVNTRTYRVKTFVQYFDHPFDGIAAGTPNDTIPTDYKRVRLTVTWGEATPEQTIYLVSNISSEGLETSTGGGVLSINVLDATGSGVSGASVRIVNTAAGIDVTPVTDATGNIILPGAPAGSQNYALTISKTAYYGAVTFPPYPTTAYAPVNVHASVVADAINQVSIVMDRNADLMLATKDPFNVSIPNIGFSLLGGRVLGADPSTSALIYSFDSSGTTSGAGTAEFLDQSHGQYTISITNVRYEFYKVLPEQSVRNIIDVLPGVNANIGIILMDKELASAKIEITHSVDASPLLGASVRLSNTTLGYDVTLTSDQYGYAYFPSVLPELVSGTYDLQVSLTGYVSNTSTVSVSGDLVIKAVSLTPN